MKKVLLLVNTGTPDNPGTGAVRKYLSEFLNDPMVIDFPRLIRKILVNFIIVPFRTSHSAGLYRKLWTEKGSPLRIHLDNLVSSCRRRLMTNIQSLEQCDMVILHFSQLLLRSEKHLLKK